MPSAGSSFRIKLEFETPPPGMPCSRKYMILVKTDVCKTIYDLEQTIIRKFGFSKGATTNLALEGFVLVPTEDIVILSNDDCVSVSTIHDAANVGMSSYRKRRSNGNTEKNVKKSTKFTEKEQTGMNEREKQTKMNKMPKNSGISKKANVRTRNVTSEKRKASSDDSSGGSTTEDEKRPQKQLKRVVKGNNAIKKERTEPRQSKASTTNSPISAVTRRTCHDVLAKTLQCKSSEADLGHIKKLAATSGLQSKAPEVKHKPQEIKATKNSGVNHITFTSSSSCSSSSESEMETGVIEQRNKTKALLHSNETEASKSLKTWLASSTNGHKCFQNYGNASTDPGVSTNISIVLENPTIINDTSETAGSAVCEQERRARNYSELLPSTWPPRVGDVIAYKVLEMSQDYTPVISGYKEAKILEILPSITSPIGVDAVKIMHLWPQQKDNKREGGRFEMDFGEDDEASDNEDLILEWKSLLEPKRVE